VKVKGKIGKVEFEAWANQNSEGQWIWFLELDGFADSNLRLFCSTEKSDAEADLKRFLNRLGAVYEVVE
jgi:hypothetical protein